METSKARAKANKMIEYFEGCKLPPSPFRLDAGVVSNDLEKTVSIAVSHLQHSKEYSAPFMAAYHRLYTIKKLINERNKTDNSGAE